MERQLSSQCSQHKEVDPKSMVLLDFLIPVPSRVRKKITRYGEERREKERREGKIQQVCSESWLPVPTSLLPKSAFHQETTVTVKVSISPLLSSFFSTPFHHLLFAMRRFILHLSSSHWLLRPPPNPCQGC